MIDHILRGMIKSHAQAEDVHVVGDMTNKMFMNTTTGMGLDLVAQIIQQGRDHGIPGYSRWRKFCNLPEINRFDDLRDVMSDDTISVLKKTYTKVFCDTVEVMPLQLPHLICSFCFCSCCWYCCFCCCTCCCCSCSSSLSL